MRRKTSRFKTKTFGGKILKNFVQRFPLQCFREKFKEVTLQKLLIAKKILRQNLTDNPSKTNAPPRTEITFFFMLRYIFANQPSNFIFQRTTRRFLCEVMQEFLIT